MARLPAYLRELEQRGVAVRPGPAALVHAQDKRTMREALTSMGAPTPGWSVVEGEDDGSGATDHGLGDGR